MWIVLGILLFIIFLVVIILLLPVYVTIKIDKENDFYFRYKFLNRTYGENPDPNNKIVKTLKNASGITELEKNLKGNSEIKSSLTILKENFTIVVGLLKEIVKLLRFCKAKVFKLKIICADECAATAAINYGECCAIAYPILGIIHSYIKVKPSGHNIDISCKYNSNESCFEFETVLVVRVFRIIAALWRVVVEEAKRQAEAAEPMPTKKAKKTATKKNNQR